MDPRINDIVSELIASRPNLAEKRGELLGLVADLIAASPAAEADPAFLARLKTELTQRFASRKVPTPSLNPFSFMKTYTFALTSVAASIVLAAGGLLFTVSRMPKAPGSNDGVARQLARLQESGPTIVPLSSDAFGSLLGNDSSTAAARPESGGGGGSSADMAARSVASPKGLGVGFGGGGGLAMPAPDFVPTQYRYLYKGEALALTDEKQTVYRRVKGGIPAGVAASELLGQGSLGLIDPSAFRNAAIQSFSIAQDVPNGYAINVDVTDGSVNIYENWLKWDRPENNCRDEQCFQQYRLKPSDMPDDASLIAIARAFLALIGVKADAYGSPFVMDDWKAALRESQQGADVYVPDSVSVVFPVKVAGKEIFDESGLKTGVMVNVNVRARLASGLWGLTTERYESSAYEAETDWKTLLAVAEKGGYRNWMPLYDAGSVKTVDVALGAPTVELVKVWNQRQNATVADELLVPSLVFPVQNVSSGENFWRKNVIVPLAKELLAENAVQQPIPYMEKSAR